MSETALCRFCQGTGRVEVARCAEIVNGRRCKNLARNDPAYFEAYPEREYTRPYCGMHGNLRIRGERYVGPIPATGTEGGSDG